MVVSELRGEKIDIIPYNEEPARFVAKALSPARVREVLVDDETQEATVIVPDDQLSLAIGREGQNARLAAKLTGWKVDIKSETEFSQEEDELTYEEGEEVDGRCAAVLSAGRRCPNASLQGSRYCGLPQHQALARFDTNQVTVLSTLSDEEVSVLADPSADDAQVRPLVERASAAFEQQGEAEEEPAAEADSSPEESDEGAAEPDVEEAAQEREQAEQELEEATEQAEADVAEAEQELEEAEEAAVEDAQSDDGAEADTGDGEDEQADDSDSEPEEESVEEPEQALAQDAATEGDEPQPEAEAAAVAANAGEESNAQSDDSEESRS
jgi:transcription termination/antitermination protein NusA